MNLPKFQKTFGDMCHKHQIISQEKNLLTKICNNESTNLEMCMLDDYFREDLLNSLEFLPKYIFFFRLLGIKINKNISLI